MANDIKGKENAVRQQAENSAKRAMQCSPSIQYAITQVLPNILNGAFWAFTDMAGIQSHIEAIKAEPNIVARKLGNACLIEVGHDFMISSVNAIDSNAITRSDLTVIHEKMADAVVEFEKFLISRGKKGNFSGMIGIYCTNNVTSINYKGVSYPAFRLGMGKALELLSTYGYAVKVNGSYIPAAQAGGTGQALWNSAMLSPTKTGIFIEVASTYNKEQIKQCEAQFKAKYGLK